MFPFLLLCKFVQMKIASKPKVIAEKDYAFANEGPVFVERRNKIIFTSNRLTTRTGKTFVELNEFFLDTSKVLSHNVSLPMGNGAWIDPITELVMICGQGTMKEPAGIYRMNPITLDTIPVVIQTKAGDSFSSPNDIFVDEYGTAWFTDPPYGYFQGFRPNPSNAPSVYRATYDSKTGNISAVQRILESHNFSRPNGITVHKSILYVTDTGYVTGNGTDREAPRSVYTWDLNDRRSLTSTGKEIIKIEKGIPDGIKFDLSGRYLFIACGDGLRIYDPQKNYTLIETISIDGGVSNFVQINDMLYILAGKKLMTSKLRNAANTSSFCSSLLIYLIVPLFTFVK